MSGRVDAEGGTHGRPDEAMPEFVMPAEVPPPVVEPAAGATEGPDRDPDALAPSTARGITDLHPGEAPPPVRRRLAWRQLIAAGAIGVVVGAAIPGGIQAVERGAAAADRAGLESLALEYVTAIAEQRADDATRLVPPRVPGDAPLLVDAALQSAIPISDPAVGVVQIDGDSGRVDVRFRSGRGEQTRTLEADRADGAWSIRTTLAERVMLYDPGFGMPTTIGGVALEPMQPVLLYPGIYTTDERDDGWVRAAATQVLVDGDPVTTSDLMVSTEVLPALAEAAGREGMRRAEACAADPECELPTGATFEAAVDPYLSGAYGPEGIELGVQLEVRLPGEEGSDIVDVPVRVQRSADGSHAFECLAPNAYMSPAPRFDWGPCG